MFFIRTKDILVIAIGMVCDDNGKQPPLPMDVRFINVQERKELQAFDT